MANMLRFLLDIMFFFFSRVYLEMYFGGWFFAVATWRPTTFLKCVHFVLSMEEILHQLRLAVYLIIYKVFIYKVFIYKVFIYKVFIYKVLYIHPGWLFWIFFINSSSSINISTFCVATNRGDVDFFFVSTWRLHITHKMNNRPKRWLQGVRLARKLMVLVDLKRNGKFREKMV